MLGYYFLRSHFPVVISAGRERVFNAEIRSPAGGLLANDWNNDCILVALECEFGVGESGKNRFTVEKVKNIIGRRV